MSDIAGKKAASYKKVSTVSSFVMMSIASIFSVSILLAISKGALSSNCVINFIFIAFLAWPIWLFLSENRLFKRRLFIDGVFKKESFLHRNLWSGALMQIILVITAFISAWLLVVIGSYLETRYFYLLLIDGVFIVFLQYWMKRKLRTQVQGDLQNLVSRGGVYWVNGGLLMIALMMMDYYIGISRPYQGAEFREVFSHYLSKSSGAAVCPLMGWGVGLFSGLDAGIKELVPQLIMSISDDTVRHLSWLGFLIQAGLLVWLFSRYMLGVHLIVERQLINKDTGVNIGSKVFNYTIVFLAIPYFALAWVSYPQQNRVDIVDPLRLDPCKPDSSLVEKYESDVDGQLNNGVKRIFSDINEIVDIQIKSVSKSGEKYVDDYLDEFFTIKGEYSRMLYALGSKVFSDVDDIEEYMEKQFRLMVMDKLDLENKIDKIEKDILDRNNNAIMNILNKAVREMKSVDIEKISCGKKSLHEGIDDLVKLSNLGSNHMFESAVATSGAASGRVMAKRAITGAISKVVANNTFKHAAQMTIRMLGKKALSVAGGMATGVASGLSCGPLAPVCSTLGGVAGGAAVWFGVDKAMIEVDEHLYRNEMKEEIMQVINRMLDDLSEDIKEKHKNNIMTVIDEVRKRTLFVPSQH